MLLLAKKGFLRLIYLEFAKFSERKFEVGRQSRVGALEITTLILRIIFVFYIFLIFWAKKFGYTPEIANVISGVCPKGRRRPKLFVFFRHFPAFL